MSMPKIDLASIQRAKLEIDSLPKLPPLPKVIWVDPSLPDERGHCLAGEYEWRVSEAGFDAFVRESLDVCAVPWRRLPTIERLIVSGFTIEVRRIPGCR